MSEPRFAFVAAESEEAQEARHRLEARYATVPAAEAEFIVALGGDGLMLETLHGSIDRGTPIYGMNRGTVGFLMNAFAEEDLPERLARAEQVTLHPLRMTAWQRNADGKPPVEALAINEVSLLRETRQSVHISIAVDGVMQLPELVGDGVLLATPAGSTAYNFSAHGPILPIGTQLLVVRCPLEEGQQVTPKGHVRMSGRRSRRCPDLRPLWATVVRILQLSCFENNHRRQPSPR